MLIVLCRCGELLQAEERERGRRIACRCGRVVEMRSVLPPPAPAPVSRPLGSWISEWRAARPSGRGSAALPAATRWGRRMAAACWLYLLAAVLACALLWGLGDRWWAATVLLFSGRWVLLAPLAALVPVAAAARPKLLLPLAGAACVMLGPVMGLQINGWPSLAGEVARERVRLVSFNTAGGDRVAPMLPDLLERWRPDLVAFQECGPPLAAALPQLPGWHHHFQDGLCLLSRFPIVGTEVMDRSTLARIHETTRIGGAGNVVRYALQAPSGVFYLNNLHLETPRKGFDALAQLDFEGMGANTVLRTIESRLARRWVDSSPGPYLVAGDFNAPVESRIYQGSWGGLDNAFSAAGRGFGMTRFNGWIRVRIDHVLMGRGWRAGRAWVAPDAGSDHRPLIADLELMESD